MIGNAQRTPRVGRCGMVARVDGRDGLDDGRLVVLEHRAGRVCALVDSDTLVESWRCRLIGGRAGGHGRQGRTLYVPDAVLTPVAWMDDNQIAELERAQALEDFDSAARALGKYLERPGVLVEDEVAYLGTGLSTAGEQAVLLHSLELVAAGTALHELGLRPVAPEQDLWRGAWEERGRRVVVEATQTPIGVWQVTCTGVSRRVWICDEVQLPAEGPRGELLLPVLRMWRSVFPGTPEPQALSPARTLGRHRKVLAVLDRSPTLQLDPPVFRAICRWLAERFGERAGTLEVTLSHADCMLRIEVEGAAFGCPAHGLWPGPCAMTLGDLLALPPAAVRRRQVCLELTTSELLVNGVPLPSSMAL